jgi:hypothetical protein
MWDMFNSEMNLNLIPFLYVKGFSFAILWLIITWFVIGVSKKTDKLEGRERTVVFTPMYIMALIFVLHTFIEIV